MLSVAHIMTPHSTVTTFNHLNRQVWGHCRTCDQHHRTHSQIIFIYSSICLCLLVFKASADAQQVLLVHFQYFLKSNYFVSVSSGRFLKSASSRRADASMWKTLCALLWLELRLRCSTAPRELVGFNILLITSTGSYLVQEWWRWPLCLWASFKRQEKRWSLSDISTS